MAEGALARYGTTTDSSLANELARCAALAPDLVADHDAFLRLAEAAFQGSPGQGNRPRRGPSAPPFIASGDSTRRYSDSMTASGWAEARERPRIGRSLPWPTTDWDIALRHAAGSPSSGPGIRRHLPASPGRASRSGSSAGRPSRWSRMPNRPDPEPALVAAAAPGPGSDRPVPGHLAEPVVQRRGVGIPSRLRFSQSEGSLP